MIRQAPRIAGVLGAFVLLCACGAAPSAGPPETAAAGNEPPTYSFTVVHTFHHDPEAFTQGLIFDRGVLYESTGLVRKSSVRKVDLQTGEVLAKRDLAPPYFGEGLTLFKGKLYQLTWLQHRGFIYDMDFNPAGQFTYDTEGWGLTHDDTSLILSDGTNRLEFIDPESSKVTRTISVYDRGTPLKELNELEYIKGEIFANVWHDDRIVRIDPKSGSITGWIDLRGLLPDGERSSPEAVLNGIAYDETEGRIFVTGKDWPKLFEIRLTAAK